MVTMITMITMITCSLSLAGSHRPTRRKPRRTSLDVLGKFVRLSPRIPYPIRIRTPTDQY